MVFLNCGSSYTSLSVTVLSTPRSMNFDCTMPTRVRCSGSPSAMAIWWLHLVESISKPSSFTRWRRSTVKDPVASITVTCIPKCKNHTVFDVHDVVCVLHSSSFILSCSCWILSPLPFVISRPCAAASSFQTTVSLNVSCFPADIAYTYYLFLRADMRNDDFASDFASPDLD